MFIKKKKQNIYKIYNIWLVHKENISLFTGTCKIKIKDKVRSHGLDTKITHGYFKKSPIFDNIKQIVWTNTLILYNIL